MLHFLFDVGTAWNDNPSLHDHLIFVLSNITVTVYKPNFYAIIYKVAGHNSPAAF